MLLIGPTLEGILGGMSTYGATVHAYISDVTPDGSRVTAFTRLAAMVMVGLAAGPMIGSALISATGNILFPFYLTIGTHLFFAILIRILLPESLSSESRAILAKRARASAQRRREREEAEIAAEHAAGASSSGANTAGESGWSLATVPLASPNPHRVRGAARRLGRRGITFLRPIGVFKPRKRADGSWDYNLMLLGVGVFVMGLNMGVLQIKSNYAFFAFQWGWAELGPYISYMGVCRFTVLVGIMPGEC